MTSVSLAQQQRSRGGDFATLSREVRHAGLLARRRGYYLVRIMGNLAVFAAGWVAFLLIGDSWWQLLTAVFFAAMFTQLAFRLEGLNLHWSSIKHVWRGDGGTRGLEAGLLVAHLVVYLTAVFTVLSPLTGLVLIAVHQGLWGVYMGCSFAPNHKGMPTLPPGHKLDYLRKQVLTSRNVRGGRWVDFVLGGLNYQIERHLFLTMPRPNLRRAQALVQDFCDRHRIDYAQCGLARSYGHVLRHLRDAGAPLRHHKEARTT